MNISLIYLSLSSFSNSPQFSFSNSNKPNLLDFSKITTKYYFSQFLFLSSDAVNCSIRKSTFQNYLNVALKIQENVNAPRYFPNFNPKLIRSEYYNYLVETAITEQRNSILNIFSCLFQSCVSTTLAGAIEFIHISGQLTVDTCSFDMCSSKQCAAIYFLGKKSDSDEPNTGGTYAISSIITNCCFMNCSGTNDGVVCKIVSNTASINNTYAVGCYNVIGTSGNFGFLMYTQRFSSEYFNITDSNMKSMSSVYIKNANPAVVKFHTNVGHTSTIIVCSYGTACSSSYSYMNLHNITLSTPVSSDWGGLIVARYASITIDHCCCTSIILSAGQYLFKNYQGSLSLNNCFYDSDFITYGNITYLSVTRMDNLTTYDCINSGVQSCNYVLRTQVFTHSEHFTQSSPFSKSNTFVSSSEFTNSNTFSKSDSFSGSNTFADFITQLITSIETPSTSEDIASNIDITTETPPAAEDISSNIDITAETSSTSEDISSNIDIETETLSESQKISTNTISMPTPIQTIANSSTEEEIADPVYMNPSKSKSNTLNLILIIIATLIVSITAILISIFGCRGTPIVPIANEEEDETEITEPDAGIDIESSSSNDYNDRVTIDEIDDVWSPIGQVEQ